MLCLLALLNVVALASPVAPVPVWLRLTGTKCHDDAEGRVFQLQNATIRERPHWTSAATGGAVPLHVTWTPPTKDSAGRTKVGGWRVDISTDPDGAADGGPRVARANFDSTIPPFGTADPGTCTDKMYCTEEGGGWREMCDGAYALSSIVLEERFAASACDQCANSCSATNGSGVLCDCCPGAPEPFVLQAPEVCQALCPAGQVLTSPPCLYPPVCVDVNGMADIWLGALFLGLSMVHSRMNVKSWTKDDAWSPGRGEDSLVGGPPGLFRSFENRRAVSRLQQARAPALPGRSKSSRARGKPDSSLAHALVGEDELSSGWNPSSSNGGDLGPPPARSGWLTEARRSNRVFVELRGNRIELWSDSNEPANNRTRLCSADLRGSVVTKMPAWRRKSEDDEGWATRLREWCIRLLAGAGQKARHDATQLFAFGFTVELAGPDSEGSDLLVFCSNSRLDDWVADCCHACGSGSQGRARFFCREHDDANNIELSIFQESTIVEAELLQGALHTNAQNGPAQVYQLRDYTVEMVVSFKTSLAVRIFGCILHLLIVWLSPLIIGFPVLLYFAGDAVPLTWYDTLLWLFAGSMLGLVPAWSAMGRADTIETFALVPRTSTSGLKAVVIRTASKWERDEWMAALSSASTAGVQGFSLAFLKRFIQQNQLFMSQPGREYVQKTTAVTDNRTMTGKVAEWDASLVEVEMGVTATTTNTTYELIKPMTEELKKTYVHVAQVNSAKLADRDVVELYGELFDDFDGDRDGYLDQDDWTRFLEAAAAAKGEGDISWEERDRQREFFDLEKAADMLGVKLQGKRISRSDFALLYRVRDAFSDYSMIKSRQGGRTVPDALYIDADRDVGPATVFVSHTWNRPFTELIESLELEERRQVERDGVYNAQNRSWPAGCTGRSPRYWIDIFMKDQWAIQGNDTMAELVAAITGPGKVIVIGDGWDPIPVCLTRVWCLFEILNTIQHQAQLSFAVFSGDFKKFQDREMKNRQRKWLRWLDQFDLLDQPERFDRGAAAFPRDTQSLPIDVRYADATVESDKAMIFNKIEQGVGHDRVNAAVKDAISDARDGAIAAEKTVRNKVWREVLYQAGFMVFFWTILLSLPKILDDGHESLGDSGGSVLPAQIMLACLLVPITLGTVNTGRVLCIAKRNAARGTDVSHRSGPLKEVLRDSLRASASFHEPGSSHGTSPSSSSPQPGRFGSSHGTSPEPGPIGLSRPASPVRALNDTRDDDEDVDIERTPSGREALSKPNQPAIFRTAETHLLV